MGGIYYILKYFGGDITIDFVSTTTRGYMNCDSIGRNRRRHRGGSWGILKDRISRSVTRNWRSCRPKRHIQTKEILGWLIRGMNVVLTLNGPSFLLPFGGSETFIMNYRNMPMFQRDLMFEWINRRVVLEYLGAFIIIDILNSAEGVIKNHVILKENMTCSKVQDQLDVSGMSRTIPKKDAIPGLWLIAGKLCTLWYFVSRTYTGHPQT